MDDGPADEVDRIKALGNAVIPQIPEIIGRVIISYENETSNQENCNDQA